VREVVGRCIQNLQAEAGVFLQTPKPDRINVSASGFFDNFGVLVFDATEFKPKLNYCP
jgi:hypothetical protein